MEKERSPINIVPTGTGPLTSILHYIPVAESGSNLSADKATANVDYADDEMIQEVIAVRFRDRAILTIAHRFNTIDLPPRISKREP